MKRSDGKRPDADVRDPSNITFFPARRAEANTETNRYDDLMRRFFLARAAEMDEDAEPGEDAGELVTRLLLTPSPEPRHLRFKMSLFAEELALEQEAGLPPMARTMALFAAIQADVLQSIEQG